MRYTPQRATTAHPEKDTNNILAELKLTRARQTGPMQKSLIVEVRNELEQSNEEVVDAEKDLIDIKAVLAQALQEIESLPVIEQKKFIHSLVAALKEYLNIQNHMTLFSPSQVEQIKREKNIDVKTLDAISIFLTSNLEIQDLRACLAKITTYSSKEKRMPTVVTTHIREKNRPPDNFLTKILFTDE